MGGSETNTALALPGLLVAIFRIPGARWSLAVPHVMNFPTPFWLPRLLFTPVKIACFRLQDIKVTIRHNPGREATLEKRHDAHP